MGAQASKSYEAQKDKFERVVNICCRDDELEFSNERVIMNQRERNRYLKDVKRKAQLELGPEGSYEMCCGYETFRDTHIVDAAGQKTLASRPKVVGESPRSNKSTPSVEKEEVRHYRGDPHRKLIPPPGWAESEVLLLKRAVEKAARAHQIRAPGFNAMQAIILSAVTVLRTIDYLQILAKLLILPAIQPHESDTCAGPSARPRARTKR